MQDNIQEENSCLTPEQYSYIGKGRISLQQVERWTRNGLQVFMLISS